MFCLFLMVCLSWAQEDTYSYTAAPPYLPTQPPYLPTEPPYLPTEPPYHPPYHGGGGHRHGSSNKELATAIAHLASDLRAFMEEQESRNAELANQIKDLVVGQNEANNMLVMLLHGGYPHGTGGRGKRAIDDYQPPWEAFTVVPPVYPTEPPTPPTYDSPLPPTNGYFTPLSFTGQVQDYSTEDSYDRKPRRAYKGPKKVQYALPGELPGRKTVLDDFLPGYSGEQSPGYYPTEPVFTTTAYPTPPPTEVVYPNPEPVKITPPPEPYPTSEGSPMHEYWEEY